MVYEHYADHLRGLAVYRAVISSSKWEALRKRLSRAKAQHVRVVQADGSVVVLHTHPQAGELVEGVEALGRALQTSCTSGANLSSSRGWSMAAAERAGKLQEEPLEEDDDGEPWTNLTTLLEPAEVLSRLAAQERVAHATARQLLDHRVTSVDWAIPPEGADERDTWLQACGLGVLDKIIEAQESHRPARKAF